MKPSRYLIYLFIILLTPLLIVTTTIRFEVSIIGLYESGFEKYQISQVSGINKNDLSNIARSLIEYFNNRVPSPQVIVTKMGERLPLYNEKELSHLKDVKDLIQLDCKIQYAVIFLMILFSFALLLLTKTRWQILLRGLFWGCIVTLGLMTILAVWSVIDFNSFFILFHLVSFSNMLWVLDPAKDYLIMLFPEGFFYDMAMLGFILIVVQSLVVGGICLGIMRLTKYHLPVQAQ